MSLSEESGKTRRDFDRELDILEAKIGELRIFYEQFFVDILPQPPEKQHAEVVRLIKRLLKAPFKNSASRFRLRSLINRFQTYATYWERVNKKHGCIWRDEPVNGTYSSTGR